MKINLIFIMLLLIPISLISATAGRCTPMSSYAAALESVKKEYPFLKWQQSGLRQYTPKACAAFTSIFDGLINELIVLGPDASEQDKIQIFKKAIKETNKLNEKDPSLIETSEREELCALTNRIAQTAGIDPKKYGGGEGPASEWREW